ncbi:hypothetical protein NSTC745_00381 [Nostoc sp. DSM 114161]
MNRGEFDAARYSSVVDRVLLISRMKTIVHDIKTL